MSSQLSEEEAIELGAPSARAECDSLEPPFWPRDSAPIGIDLSTLLRGSRNGGAKLVALEIARTLPRVAPRDSFLILTGASCHEELSELERANVRRWLLPEGSSGWERVLLDQPPMKALLCPMTAPPWADPRVPMISLVHDLQHLALPAFFSQEELEARSEIYHLVEQAAEHVLTPSEYVRASLIEHLGLPASRVTVMHHGRSDRFQGLSESEVEQVLWKYGLEPGSFFLFPANPWPHKNHHLLLTAFAIFLDRHRDRDLHLVLTGSADPATSELAKSVVRCGLGDRVLVMGFVDEGVLEALLRSCLALVFPSLYEGFGLPVIEAMSFGRPVLASRCTALPETAGGAALLFDPRRPDEIVRAMEQVAFEPSLADEHGRRGRERAATIGDGENMGRRYLELIRRRFASGIRLPNAYTGVWADGWTGRHLVIVSAEFVEIDLELSNWRGDTVDVSWTVGADRETTRFDPGEIRHVVFDLDPESQIFHLLVHDTHCPAEGGDSDDARELGLHLSSATVVDADGRKRPLAEIFRHA